MLNTKASGNFVLFLMAAVAVILISVSGVNATAISVNLVAISSNGVDPDPAILGPGETAGLVPAANWNNWELSKIGVGIPEASKTFSGIVDDSGTATSSQIVYSQSGNHAMATSATYDYTPTDEKLFRRYVDQWGNNRSSSYTVTNLPSSITQHGYNVIVYTSSTAHLDNRSGTIKIDDAADGTFDQTKYVWGGANPYSSEVGYVEQTYASLAEAKNAYQDGNADGNYIMFTGLTSDSFELEVYVNSDSGAQRVPVNGFQIVAVPEPVTIALMGLGFVSLRFRKRGV